MGFACQTELGPVSIPFFVLNSLMHDDGRAGGPPHFGGYHPCVFLVGLARSHSTSLSLTLILWCSLISSPPLWALPAYWTDHLSIHTSCRWFPMPPTFHQKQQPQTLRAGRDLNSHFWASTPSDSPHSFWQVLSALWRPWLNLLPVT